MTTPSLLAHAREAAHQAVKAFDLAPGDATARHAIEALSEYRGILANTRTPKTREEMAAFATAWDAKVEESRKLEPQPLPDNYYTRRGVTPSGHDFTGPNYAAHPGHDHEDCCK